MNAPVTRRSLLGSSTAAIGAVSALALSAPALASAAGHAVLSTNDARLVALVEAYEEVERRCAVHTAAVRGLADSDEEGFHEIARHLVPIEDEMTSLPADTLAGVVAKARLCRSQTIRDIEDPGLLFSLADDVWRLFGSGALS